MARCCKMVPPENSTVVGVSVHCRGAMTISTFVHQADLFEVDGSGCPNFNQRGLIIRVGILTRGTQTTFKNCAKWMEDRVPYEGVSVCPNFNWKIEMMGYLLVSP